jgi:hypothetical protein
MGHQAQQKCVFFSFCRLRAPALALRLVVPVCALLLLLLLHGNSTPKAHSDSVKFTAFWGAKGDRRKGCLYLTQIYFKCVFSHLSLCKLHKSLYNSLQIPVRITREGNPQLDPSPFILKHTFYLRVGLWDRRSFPSTCLFENFYNI